MLSYSLQEPERKWHRGNTESHTESHSNFSSLFIVCLQSLNTACAKVDLNNNVTHCNNFIDIFAHLDLSLVASNMYATFGQLLSLLLG